MSAMEVDFDSLQVRPNEVSAEAHPETARLLAELDHKKSARRIAVPTKDLDVRSRLREMGEPITLFGERPEDRRDRLRTLWSKRQGAAAGAEVESESDSSGESESEEEFYTEGGMALKNARLRVASYSMERAKKRIARQKQETTLPLARLMDVRRAVFNKLKSFTNLGSQIGDTRPLSTIRFSPDSSLLLTSSWTGTTKLWNIPSCKEVRSYKGHKERIGGLAWHPQATLSQQKTEVNFATGAADSEIKLWGLENDQPLLTLSGHSARVCRVAFHPSGNYLGSASYDGTWRLWDVEYGVQTGGLGTKPAERELLLQEGHSKEVYAIEFQGDGALVCTGGLDAIGRVWDLRSGKTAMVLDGHVRDILGIDFSPNGHQIATGSNDDTIRIWDMRSLKSIKTIPAHTSAVSDLKFFRSLPGAFKGLEAFGTQEREVDVPVDGLFLVSSGYDGFVKVWSADDWMCVKTLGSDKEGKVMSVDVSSDARFLASAEYTRTFKIWSDPDASL